jgi:hypothetical protein
MGRDFWLDGLTVLLAGLAIGLAPYIALTHGGW